MRNINVFIVNAYFDADKRGGAIRYFSPQTIAPIFLSGYLSEHYCNIKIHCEMLNGKINDNGIFYWADVVIITGLTQSFDRMRQISACFKSINRSCIVIAGGHAIRSLPKYSKLFFDHVSYGDVSSIYDVFYQFNLEKYTSDHWNPRYDLVKWPFNQAFIETSIGCNFSCDFCSIPKSGDVYRSHSDSYIEKQIIKCKDKRYLYMLDNNFYGNNIDDFLRRLDIIKYYYKKNYFKGWSALVTSDFFFKENNIHMVKNAGCKGLFTGVEFIDEDMNNFYNKKQNRKSNIEYISDTCFSNGIIFQYGLIYDPSNMSIKMMDEQTKYIYNNNKIPSPSYISISVPIIGTKLFYDSVKNRLLLPNLSLRDMDGSTVVQWPIDKISEVIKYVSGIINLEKFMIKNIEKSVYINNKYKELSTDQNIYLYARAIKHIYRSYFFTFRKKNSRSYFSTTEDNILDYRRPKFLLREYDKYYDVTYVTNSQGELNEEIS